MSKSDLECPRCGSDEVDPVENEYFPEATHGCDDCLFLGQRRDFEPAGQESQR